MVKNQLSILLMVGAFLGSWAVVVPMGEQQQLGTREPVFVDLDDGCENFTVRVKDESTTTVVEQFSFSGQTTIGGILREDNDTVTELDLRNIKYIKVIEQRYSSKRYPEKDLALIEKASVDGTETKGLLLPRQVIVCGIEKNGDRKACYLSKIDEIIVERSEDKQENPLQNPPPAIPPQAVTSQKEEIIQEVAQGGQPPIVGTGEFKVKTIKVVETAPEVLNEKKTFNRAITELVLSVIEVIKAFFRMVTGLFW